MPSAKAWLEVASHCGVRLEELVQEVADRLRLPVARLDRRDAHVTKLVPGRIARRFHVVPLRASDRQILIATDDPLNNELEQRIAFVSGRSLLKVQAACVRRSRGPIRPAGRGASVPA